MKIYLFFILYGPLIGGKNFMIKLLPKKGHIQNMSKGYFLLAVDIYVKFAGPLFPWE